MSLAVASTSSTPQPPQLKPMYTSPSDTFTGYTAMVPQSPFRFSPVKREKVRLCMGQATLGSPFSSPIRPRESTISMRWGHKFWQAYQRPWAVKWKTAICLSWYLTQAPALSGKAWIGPALNQILTSDSATGVYLESKVCIIERFEGSGVRGFVVRGFGSSGGWGKAQERRTNPRTPELRTPEPSTKLLAFSVPVSLQIRCSHPFLHY